MSVRKLKDRPSLKKQESSVIAEDEAYIEFHTLVFNTLREKHSYTKIYLAPVLSR